MRTFLAAERVSLGQDGLTERLLAGETVLMHDREEMLAFAASGAGRRFFTELDVQSLMAAGICDGPDLLGARRIAHDDDNRTAAVLFLMRVASGGGNWYR